MSAAKMAASLRDWLSDIAISGQHTHAELVCKLTMHILDLDQITLGAFACLDLFQKKDCVTCDSAYRIDVDQRRF